MLARLARFTIRRRRLILAGSVLFAVAAAMFGGSVISSLRSGGFTDPGSESIRGAQLQSRIFGASDPNLVLLVTAKHGTVDGLAVVGTLLILKVVASLTDVSIYALNLTTAMGIGLGIDYALFIVSRFREELRAGRGTEDAVVRTMETAGRTVLFSALTVAVSLSALLVFPLYFLRSFAYAGIAVVALAALGAVVFLPALLATLGPRVDKLVLWRRRQRPVGEGFWHRLATFVMRRPIPVAGAVIAILLVLGAPFLGVKFGSPDDRVLPTSAPARQVSDDIRSRFSDREASPLSVVGPDTTRAG